MSTLFVPAEPRLAPHGSPVERGFRSDIEGLRGLAVLLVVAFHAGLPGVSGGFVGVDVFFVLSGYLITALLVKEAERSGRIDIAGFYARRIRRLLPASALMLLATAAASAVWLSPLERVEVNPSLVATSVYASNLLFMVQATDYFSAGVEDNPLLHTWSLAVEEQFYLVWPLLILLGLRGQTSRRRLIGVMAGMSALSLVGAVWLTEVRQPWAFFAMPARAWEFGLGGLAGLVGAKRLPLLGRWVHVLGAAGLLAIVGAAAGYTSGTSFPGVAAILPVAGTVAVLLAGAAAPGRGVDRLLRLPPMQYLGKLSYSWYLWHWPVLVFAGVLLPSLGVPGRLVGALGALLLADVAHRLVENPIRFHPRLVQSRALSVGLGVALTLGGVAVALSAYALVRQSTRSGAHSAFFAASKDRHPREKACLADFGEAGLVECTFGDSTASQTVVLMGDSHAAHWLSAVELVAREREWKVISLLKAACPGAEIEVYLNNLGRAYDECGVWRAAALQRILDLRPDAVLMVNNTPYKRGPVEPVSSVEWRDGFRRTLGALDEGRIRTIVLHGTPELDQNVPNCLSHATLRGTPAETACSRPREEALDERVFSAAKAAADGLRNISFIDLSSEFCSASMCEPVRDGKVVYRDNSHLTKTFVASLAPRLAARLAPLVGQGDGWARPVSQRR